MKRLVIITAILALVACDKPKQSAEKNAPADAPAKTEAPPKPPAKPLEAPLYKMRKVEKANGVLFLLHGFGSNESNFLQFASKLQLPWTIVSVRAPLDLKRGRYAWFPRDAVDDPERAATETERLKQFIESPPAEVGPAPKKVVLGFSQGAMMSLRLAAAGTKADGFAVLSGRWPDQVSTSEKVSDAAYFVAHGTKDTVIRPEESERIIRTLRELDQQPVSKSYHMMGHTIGLDTRQDLVSWMNSLLAPRVGSDGGAAKPKTDAAKP